jgi:hypothetical protein
LRGLTAAADNAEKRAAATSQDVVDNTMGNGDERGRNRTNEDSAAQRERQKKKKIRRLSLDESIRRQGHHDMDKKPLRTITPLPAFQRK